MLLMPSTMLSPSKICSLRDSEGDWVDKPPWRITWGGGASVESPHFQRVHYCELLVRPSLHIIWRRRD
jgi:hypothetical protein